jgi:hypothetical protein
VTFFFLPFPAAISSSITLPAEHAHQRAAGQHVPLHRRDERIASRPRGHGQDRVKCKNLEMVMVRGIVVGRPRPHVADLAARVLSLQRTFA